MKPDERKHVDVVIERLLREGIASDLLAADAPDFFPTAIPAEEGEALAARIEREAASRTVEIGLGYGVSALFIGRALLGVADAEKKHVAMDPNQTASFSNHGLRLLKEAGLEELVEFFEEESQIVLPRLLSEGRQFDLAFVDGNHRFDRVFLDLVYLGRMLRPGGIVFVDDYQMPAIARATSFFTTNLGWVLEELSPDDELHQWAVFRTSTSPDERPFDYYIDF